MKQDANEVESVVKQLLLKVRKAKMMLTLMQ
jgi:hypothetical protein